MLCSGFANSLIETLENSSGAHAAAYAHGYQSIAEVAAFHFVEERGGEFGSGAA